MGALMTLPEMEKASLVMATSGMFGIKDAKQYLALALVAQAEGKHLATVSMEYDVIQGRPALKSSAMLARYFAAGGKIHWVERTDAKVTAKFFHEASGDLEVTWDMERAKNAGLLGKDNWRKYPAQMLSARVISEGVRASFPGCLAGFYASEEVRDFVPAEVVEVNTDGMTKAPGIARIEAVGEETKFVDIRPEGPEQLVPMETLLERMTACKTLDALRKWADEDKDSFKALNPTAYDNVNAAYKQRYNELSASENPAVKDVAKPAADKANKVKLAGDGMIKTIIMTIKAADKDPENPMFKDQDEIMAFAKYIFGKQSLKEVTHDEAMSFYRDHTKDKAALRELFGRFQDGK